LSKLFSREDFKNPRDGEAGYFIIQNEKGGETFNSEKFSLFLNNQLVESGCSTPGRDRARFYVQVRPDDTM
jgi:hypothetical protein